MQSSKVCSNTMLMISLWVVVVLGIWNFAWWEYDLVRFAVTPCNDLSMSCGGSRIWNFAWWEYDLVRIAVFFLSMTIIQLPIGLGPTWWARSEHHVSRGGFPGCHLGISSACSHSHSVEWSGLGGHSRKPSCLESSTWIDDDLACRVRIPLRAVHHRLPGLKPGGLR